MFRDKTFCQAELKEKQRHLSFRKAEALSGSLTRRRIQRIAYSAALDGSFGFLRWCWNPLDWIPDKPAVFREGTIQHPGVEGFSCMYCPLIRSNP
jgi:hypothetical protein